MLDVSGCSLAKQVVYVWYQAMKCCRGFALLGLLCGVLACGRYGGAASARGRAAGALLLKDYARIWGRQSLAALETIDVVVDARDECDHAERCGD